MHQKTPQNAANPKATQTAWPCQEGSNKSFRKTSNPKPAEKIKVQLRESINKYGKKTGTINNQGLILKSRLEQTELLSDGTSRTNRAK